MEFNKISAKLLTLLAFASLLLTACSSGKKDSRTVDVRSFPTTQPILMDTLINEEFVADIQSPQHVEIRARVRGFMEKIFVDEGQEVQQGQLLFKLSSQEYSEELRRAEAILKSTLAEVKMVEVERKSTHSLLEKNIVSQTELDMAEARLEAAQAKAEEAKAAVSAAKLNLAFTEIRAPFAGIINREPNKVGSLIEEGMLLTTLSANHFVYSYFNVSEKKYLELMRQPDVNWKKNISLLLADGQVHPFPGTVETAETVVDKNTGNIAFRARFANPGHLLKHGASGKVVIRHEMKGAMLIPQKSTFDVQDKTFVYVIDEDDTIRRRSIVTKARLGHLFVIESGLSINDRLIYEGIQQVREGDKVAPQMKTLQDLMGSLAIR